VSVTPEIEAEILRALDANPKRFSAIRIAKSVGATMAEVKAVVNRYRAQVLNETSGAITRAELEVYITAARRVTEHGWNNADEGVIAARRAFEAGTHDMATYRDGPWLYLCSFPLSRRRPPRPGYFTGRPL
jgi:repressor of nif and glnA expression